MPEDTQPPRSGGKPEERKPPFGPTVLRPPKRNAPGAAPDGASQPAPPPAPTVIKSDVPRAARPDRARPPAPPVTAPTAIPGVERKRLPVTLDDLTPLAAGASPQVMDRALRLLQGYVADGATERTAILWGYKAQQDYADLISETLSLSQALIFKKSTRYIARVLEILKAIDLSAVSDGGAGAGARGYFRKMTKKIDTRDELEAARKELDQLLGLMRGALNELLDLKDKLEQSSTRVTDIGTDVEAAALAAQFLSNYLQPTEKRLSERFLERSMSLTQTALQIKGSNFTRETEIDQPLRLISAIQNVALVMIPAWLGSIASMTVLTQGRAPTQTEAGELTDQLQKILEQLQT